MTDLGLVLVHYHTPHLAAAAVDRLRSVARADGVALTIALVDNGSDQDGTAMLRSLATSADLQLVEPGRNLGYAGAANLAVAMLGAPRLGLMNSDVLVLPGCLRALVEALDAGAGVAGPRHYWDDGLRLMLPPGERRGLFSELVATLGRHSSSWTGVARARWRSHARRHWLASGPVEGELSGAMLVFTASTWLAAGPLDEGYRLYFEETDWLARARRAGAGVRYVPAATAVHLYAQSTALEPAAASWFAASAERFRREHYGVLANAVLRRIERRAVPGCSFPPGPSAGPAVPPGEHWYEVSTEPAGYPAAGERWTGRPRDWRLPVEIERRHPGVGLFVRVVDPSGRELARHRFTPHESGGEPRPLLGGTAAIVDRDGRAGRDVE
ncbi:MAG TPA: glycosyltransferase [Thermoanaerobaculia bacterium]|nr:glycosyltransferase [Thermoanaerobaculia bacterium]